MENINTTATPLTKASGLPEKQKKAATILGIIILVGTVLATLIDSICNIIFYTEMYGDSVHTITSVSPVLMGNLISIIPNIIFSVYLLAFYKKNPAHATIKVYIFSLMAYDVLGIFSCIMSLVSTFDNYYYGSPPESLIITPLVNLIDYILALAFTIIFCVVIFGKFKNYKLARIIQIASLVTYIVHRVVFYSLGTTIYTEAVWIICCAFASMVLAAKIAFWFICIDKATPYHIPEKKKPVSYPAYNLPTQQIVIQPVVQPMPQQPVAPPVYQPPVQPVAPPIYQPPVQPTAAPATDDDVEAKLLKINHLLETGLITQDEFDKKKAEILNRI